MHAVVARSTIRDFEQAGKWLEEEALPRLLQTPGFVSGHWVRLDENTGLSLLAFESEAIARTAMERFNPPPTVTPISLEIGEVQAHV
jgi:hypothetical protein